jgi:hypothetical protein
MIIPRTTTEEVSIMIWTQETQKQIILTSSCFFFFFPFWATESITWRGGRYIKLKTKTLLNLLVEIDNSLLWVVWPFWVSERKQIRPCSLSYIVLKIKLTFNARESTKKCLIEKTPVILAIVL